MTKVAATFETRNGRTGAVIYTHRVAGSMVRDALLATALGTLGAVILFYGWSGGFRQLGWFLWVA